MSLLMNRPVALLIAALLLGACGVQPPSRPSAATTEGQQPAPTSPFKRITAAIRGAPSSMVQQRTQRGSAVRGLDGIEELVSAGLTYLKGNDTARAGQLADDVPTLENGGWKLPPDGRMETTWRIRSDARWQDGTPVTSADILFTTTVEQDRDLEIPAYAEYRLIDRIEAPDAQTIHVTWKRPYIDADTMFSYRAAGLPMAKHILETAYDEDKTTFLGSSLWNTGFIGTGAYRIKEWVGDSHVVLSANNDYVLGRPKIDEIEVRFIPDNDTLLANVLAGLDLTLGKTISLDMALQARDSWTDGRMAIMPQNWTPLNVQFVNPDPPIVADVRFRRAMLEALDRQQLAEFVFSGQATAADSYVGPDFPYYAMIEPYIVKYAYDPRQAAQTLGSLGYSKRPDGFYVDGTGQQLAVSIFAPVQNDIHPKATAAVAAMWQQLGVSTEQVLIPPQRMSDRQYVAEFPSFQMVERPNMLLVSEIYRLHGSQMQSAENHWTTPGTTRYQNAEFDAFLDRYVTTIPIPERMQALGGLMHHMTENLTHLPLFYGVDPTMISNRLVGPTARGAAFTQAWNVQDWDLQ